MTGLHLRTIQRLESKGKGSMETLKAIAAVFEVNADELISKEQEPNLIWWNSVQQSLRNYSNFSHTSSRYEYWCFFLFTLITLALSKVIHEKIYMICFLILLLPLVAVGTRRLNDAGLSPWWQLLLLVPFGQIPVFIMYAMKSNKTAH